MLWNQKKDVVLSVRMAVCLSVSSIAPLLLSSSRLSVGSRLSADIVNWFTYRHVYQLEYVEPEHHLKLPEPSDSSTVFGR